MAVNKSYIRPHTEVYQFLDKTVESTGQHLTACIIGSQYDLYRYGKEKIAATPITTTTIVGGKIAVAYTYDKDPLLDYEVDHDSFQVVCENALLDIIGTELSQTCYAKSTDYSTLLFGTEDTPQIISSPEASDLPAEFGGYSIQVGDILVVSNDGTDIQCTVTALVQKEDAINKYIGVHLDTYPIDLSKTTKVCTLKRILKAYSGVLEVLTPTEDTADGTVEVSTTVKILVDGQTKDTTLFPGKGELYPEFRVRVIPPMDEDVFVLSSVDDIQDSLGTIDVQNELAYAAWCAVRGSAGRGVYVIRLRTDDVYGYSEALKKIDADSAPYSIVPVVNGSREVDNDIINLVAQHCADKSQPEVQLWRTAIIGVDVPDEYTVKFVNQGTGNVSAYFAPASDTDTNSTLVQLADSKFSFNSMVVNGGQGKVAPGDYVEITGGTRYMVKEVLADNLLRLVDGPAGKATQNISIVKVSSAANSKSFIHGITDMLQTRRATVVWCDQGTYNGKVITNAYIAAEVAGISSAVQPQQSITTTEIQSVSACPRMYNRYTQKQLDEIAAGGVLIVTQDNKYTPSYIRHQLTTDPVNGQLYSEMSITRNLDNISYAVADVIKGYCGRANITEQSLIALRLDILSVLSGFTSDSTDALIGPSLVRYYDLTVQQDPKHMDQVIVNVTYEMPLPMNVIKVYQMVYKASISLNETVEQ